MGNLEKNNRSSGIVIPFLQTGEYYFKKGMTAHHQQHLTKARMYLKRSVQIEPHQPTYAYELAIVLMELGEHQESNNIFLHIIQTLDKKMTQCFFFLANNYAYLGLFRKALHYAEMYIEHNPEGEFSEDVEDLIEIVVMENEDPYNEDLQEDVILKQEYVRQLLDAGEFYEAIEKLEELLLEHPTFWVAHNNLALSYFYTGNIEKACEIVRYVLQEDTGNIYALCNIIVFSYYTNDNETVERYGEMLEKIYPLSVEHCCKVAVTLALIGHYKSAFKWLRYLQKSGYEADLAFYYWFAICAYECGHKQFAENIWRKFNQLDDSEKHEAPWIKKLDVIKELEELKVLKQHAEILFELFKEKEGTKVIELEGNLQQLFTAEQVNESFQVARCLYGNEVGEQLCLLWFHVYIKSSNQVNFVNYTAWAAAVEYICLKNTKYAKSQKTIAKSYDISIGTVAKYVRLIRDIVK